MKNRKELGQFLKESRLVVNLSQWEVAKALGYSSSQIVSNWERGMQAPPINNLKKLCTMYKLEPTEVVDIIVEQYRCRIHSQIGIKKA